MIATESSSSRKSATVKTSIAKKLANNASMDTELIGHTVDTVKKSGWAGLKNGKLLEKAQGRQADGF